MADDGAIVVYRGLNNQSEGIIHHHDSRSDNIAVPATVLTYLRSNVHRMEEGLIKRLVISSVFKFRTKLHPRCRKSHRAPDQSYIGWKFFHVTLHPRRALILLVSSCLFFQDLLMPNKSLKSLYISSSLFPLMS